MKVIISCFCRQFVAIQPTHHVILPCIVSDSLMNMIKTKYYEKKDREIEIEGLKRMAELSCYCKSSSCFSRNNQNKK